MKDQQDNKYFKDCLNRVLGRCKGCKRDYNHEHHPNNLDCPRHKGISMFIVEIEPIEQIITKGILGDLNENI